MVIDMDLNKYDLKEGKHASMDQGACVMELVSFLAKEPWSDHPACACPVLTRQAMRFNDRVDHETRQRLKVLIPLLLNSRDPSKERARANLIRFRVVTVFLPILTEGLGLIEITERLRGFTPETMKEAAQFIRDSRPAIRNAYAADADAADAADAAADADADAADAADAAADADAADADAADAADAAADAADADAADAAYAAAADAAYAAAAAADAAYAAADAADAAAADAAYAAYAAAADAAYAAYAADAAYAAAADAAYADAAYAAGPKKAFWFDVRNKIWAAWFDAIKAACEV